MEKKVFIGMGRSGSGKGTQLKLLAQYLKEKYSEIEQQAYDCGGEFREFFSKQSFFGDRVKESVTAGNYQPDFIATTLVFKKMFPNINSSDFIFIEGHPRSIVQMNDLKGLLQYCGIGTAVVINLEVSEEEIMKRLLLRGRHDDTEAGITKRFDEYRRGVLPTIEAVQKDSFFTYLEIDGMPTPEEIHEDIKKKLGI